MAIISPLTYTIANGQAVDAVPLMADLNQIVSNVNTNAAGLSQSNTFASGTTQNFGSATTLVSGAASGTAQPVQAQQLANDSLPIHATSGPGATPFALRNYFINGGAQVGQRGSVTISSTTNVYGWVDRWLISISGTTVSALGYQASAQSWTTTGYAIQVGNVTTTGATVIGIQQRIESLNVYRLNGSTITITGKVLQTSGATQTLTLVLNKANAADNFNGGVTQIATTTVSVPNNVATPFTWTLTLGASDASNGIAFQAVYNTLPAQSNTQFYWGDLQLEAGPTATPFECRPYGMELALCQRYYAVGPLTLTAGGNGGFNNVYSPRVALPVTMRAVPTVTTTDNVGNVGKVTYYSGGVETDNATPTFASLTNGAFCVQATTGNTTTDLMAFSYTADSEL